MNEPLFKKIAEEVEKEWQMGGLSTGLYYDFAKEVAEKYIADLLKDISIDKVNPKLFNQFLDNIYLCGGPMK